MIKLIGSIFLQGFLGYIGGALIGTFILAPVCINQGVKNAFFPNTPNLAIIFWCYFWISLVGALGGVAIAVKRWLQLRVK